MIKGQIVYDRILHGPCFSKVLLGQYWYDIEVHVRPELATLYVDGHLVTKIEPTFPGVAKAGVLAITGFRNLILFKEPTMVKRSLRYGELSLGFRCLCLLRSRWNSVSLPI